MCVCIFSQNLCDRRKQGLEGLPESLLTAVVVEESAA